jgi:hypothetical protein
MRGDENGNAELLEPRHEKRDEPERRPVHPLRVVDDDAERTARGEVGAQPVQRMLDRERPVHGRIDIECAR